MKKIIAIMLSILMLLGCAAAETAAPAEKTSIGTISINGAFNLQCGLPEGYKPKIEVIVDDKGKTLQFIDNGIGMTEEEVDERLRRIMADIHAACLKYGTEEDGYINYVKGANIAGFIKVANAMVEQGAV